MRPGNSVIRPPSPGAGSMSTSASPTAASGAAHAHFFNHIASTIVRKPNPRVLVVHSDEARGFTLVAELTRIHCVVETASDMVSVVNKFRYPRYHDLIVIDRMVGDTAGVAIAQELRSIELHEQYQNRALEAAKTGATPSARRGRKQQQEQSAQEQAAVRRAMATGEPLPRSIVFGLCDTGEQRGPMAQAPSLNPHRADGGSSSTVPLPLDTVYRFAFDAVLRYPTSMHMNFIEEHFTTREPTTKLADPPTHAEVLRAVSSIAQGRYSSVALAQMRRQDEAAAALADPGYLANKLKSAEQDLRAAQDALREAEAETDVALESAQALRQELDSALDARAAAEADVTRLSLALKKRDAELATVDAEFKTYRDSIADMLAREREVIHADRAELEAERAAFDEAKAAKKARRGRSRSKSPKKGKTLNSSPVADPQLSAAAIADRKQNALVTTLTFQTEELQRLRRDLFDAQSALHQSRSEQQLLEVKLHRTRQHLAFTLRQPGALTGNANLTHLNAFASSPASPVTLLNQSSAERPRPRRRSSVMFGASFDGTNDGNSAAPSPRHLVKWAGDESGIMPSDSDPFAGTVGTVGGEGSHDEANQRRRQTVLREARQQRHNSRRLSMSNVSMDAALTKVALRAARRAWRCGLEKVEQAAMAGHDAASANGRDALLMELHGGGDALRRERGQLSRHVAALEAAVASFGKVDVSAEVLDAAEAVYSDATRNLARSHAPRTEIVRDLVKHFALDVHDAGEATRRLFTEAVVDVMRVTAAVVQQCHRYAAALVEDEAQHSAGQPKVSVACQPSAAPSLHPSPVTASPPPQRSLAGTPQAAALSRVPSPPPSSGRRAGSSKPADAVATEAISPEPLPPGGPTAAATALVSLVQGLDTRVVFVLKRASERLMQQQVARQNGFVDGAAALFRTVDSVVLPLVTAAAVSSNAKPRADFATQTDAPLPVNEGLLETIDRDLTSTIEKYDDDYGDGDGAADAPTAFASFARITSMIGQRMARRQSAAATGPFAQSTHGATSINFTVG